MKERAIIRWEHSPAPLPLPCFLLCRDLLFPPLFILEPLSLELLGPVLGIEEDRGDSSLGDGWPCCRSKRRRRGPRRGWPRGRSWADNRRYRGRPRLSRLSLTYQVLEPRLGVYSWGGCCVCSACCYLWAGFFIGLCRLVDSGGVRLQPG